MPTPCTPALVVRRLHDDIVRQPKDSEVVSMADTQKADLSKWAKVIKDAGVKPD